VLGFEHHDHAFAFGANELAGLRVFLAEPAATTPTADDIATGGIGNCIACHAPPHFTDFGFHNTGVAQEDYDGVHGAGAFAALAIPGLAEREASPAAFLPPSALYPTGAGPFLAPPAASTPGLTDLGVWNVLGNEAVPGPQATLAATLGRATGVTEMAELLPLAIARFKTAGLRDLGQSAPYFHTGGAADLDAVVMHYLTASAAARASSVRNGDPELRRIAITADDVTALTAFLRALDEDYD
jgi:cytochrome c peroxidase